jgi:hypothetical protein
MSDYIPKPNTGSLFPNTRKEEDRHPDMTGNIFLSKELVRERLDATEGDDWWSGSPLAAGTTLLGVLA